MTCILLFPEILQEIACISILCGEIADSTSPIWIGFFPATRCENCSSSRCSKALRQMPSVVPLCKFSCCRLICALVMKSTSLPALMTNTRRWCTNGWEGVHPCKRGVLSNMACSTKYERSPWKHNLPPRPGKEESPCSEYTTHYEASVLAADWIEHRCRTVAASGYAENDPQNDGPRQLGAV